MEKNDSRKRGKNVGEINSDEDLICNYSLWKSNVRGRWMYIHYIKCNRRTMDQLNNIT